MVCYLQETHFAYKDIDSFKKKEKKKTYHVNTFKKSYDGYISIRPNRL